MPSIYVIDLNLNAYIAQILFNRKESSYEAVLLVILSVKSTIRESTVIVGVCSSCH
jgi:hypothetical protein